MAETLQGEKVILKPITVSDTDLIVRWRNSKSVRSMFLFRETITAEMHMKWLNEKVIPGKVVQFIIFQKDDEKKIGSVYLRDVDLDNRSAEFGIFIGEEEAKGKGLGTEAAKLIVEYGFSVLKLHRIFLRVLEENKRAIGSYLKSGFNVEGVARDMVYIDGDYHNIVFMSCINDTSNNDRKGDSQ